MGEKALYQLQVIMNQREMKTGERQLSQRLSEGFRKE